MSYSEKLALVTQILGPLLPTTTAQVEATPAELADRLEAAHRAIRQAILAATRLPLNASASSPRAANLQGLKRRHLRALVRALEHRLLQNGVEPYPEVNVLDLLPALSIRRGGLTYHREQQ